MMQPDVLSTETLLARTVAQLPTQGLGNGALAFATDGRKATESSGAGTGVPVWYDKDDEVWRTFYDNSDISDIPDLFYTRRHIEAYISSAAATTISNTSDFFQVAGTFTNSVAGAGFTVDSGGQVTYTAARTRMLHTYSSWGVSSGTNNQVIEVGVRKNGAVITASIIRRKIAVAGDVGSSALHSMFTVATGDTFDVAVRNTSGSNAVTFDNLNFGVITMPNDMTGIEVP